MFGWLMARLKGGSDLVRRETIDQLVSPQATAIAIAEVVAEHFDAVGRGTVPYPYYKADKATAATTWDYTRIEAVRQMFGYGAASLLDLADVRTQRGLLDRISSVDPTFDAVPACGDVLTDTVNAIWSVYAYLDRAGSDVMDAHTDRASLSKQDKTIFDDFLRNAMEARTSWGEMNLPTWEPPPMLIDLLWGDVTAKAKGIGLARVFGPFPKAGLENMVNLVVRSGGTEADVTAVRETYARYLAAPSPDNMRPQRRPSHA